MDLPPLVLENDDGEIKEVPDYPSIARGYAEAAADDKSNVCKQIRQAARRYLRMLEMSDDPKNEFYYSPAHVVDYCSFIENLEHVESGRWEIEQRQPDGTVNPYILLEPSQVWAESAIQGFRRRFTDERLVTKAIEVLPRKNAKSYRLAPAALFDLCCSGQIGAQIPLAASTAKQLDDTLYGVLLKFLAKNTDLVEKFGITSTKDEVKAGDGRIFKLSSQGERQDGLNPSLAVFEEGHAGSASVYSVVMSAFGARPNALLRMITTAGYLPEGPGYDLQTEAELILNGKVENYTLFAAIYTLDREDYIDPETNAIMWERLFSDERLIAKANPMYGVSLDPVRIREDMNTARRRFDLRGEFARTRFNLWTAAGVALIAAEQWAGCKRRISLDQFFGAKCWMGVDLASYNDMCAIGLVFELGPDVLAVFANYFIPEGSPLLADSDSHDRVKYWQEQGWLTITDGPEADYDAIEREITVYCEMFDVQAVGFDPYQSNQISKRIYNLGIDVYRYANNAKSMTTPTDDLLGRIVGNRLAHDGNGVLSWNAGNVYGTRKGNGSILPKKDKDDSPRKIDGFVAICMANGLRMEVDVTADKAERPTENPYEKRGLLGFKENN